MCSGEFIALAKMVDTARQLLDELMGRNRNLDPNTAKIKKIHWDDPEVSGGAIVEIIRHSGQTFN